MTTMSNSAIQIHVLVLLQWSDEINRDLPHEFGVVLGEHDTVHGTFAVPVNSQGIVDLEYLKTRMGQFATIQPYDSPFGLYAIVRNSNDDEDYKTKALLRLVEIYKQVTLQLGPEKSIGSILFLVLESHIRNSGRYAAQPEQDPVETYTYIQDTVAPIASSIISDITENAAINTISNFPKYLVDNDTAGDAETTEKQLQRQIDNLTYAIYILKKSVAKLLQYYDSNSEAMDNTVNNNRINRLTVHLANKIQAFQDMQRYHQNQENTTQTQLLQLSLLTDQVQAIRMLKSRIKTLMAQQVISATRQV